MRIAPYRSARRQQGVVLFIALIVLVAMALAGVAMRRSVDTTLGIAGNLAFKQATLLSSDQAVNAAYAYIAGPPPCGGGGTLTCDDPANGYLSSLAAEPNWFDPAAWGNAVDVFPGNTDAAGNRVRYIIHRLCSQPGPYNNPAPQQCAQYTPVGGGASGSTMAVGSYQFTGTPQVYIRITTRVDGPRNTVSITQTAVLVNAT
jgi:type IV pilus assembly protein PilX